MAKPAQRLKGYLSRRQKTRGLDLEFIHSFDSGPDGGFDCRASDIAAVLALLDEAERALTYWLPDETMIPDGHVGAWHEARRTLAKLRGEA